MCNVLLPEPELLALDSGLILFLADQEIHSKLWRSIPTSAHSPEQYSWLELHLPRAISCNAVCYLKLTLQYAPQTDRSF